MRSLKSILNPKHNLVSQYFSSSFAGLSLSLRSVLCKASCVFTDEIKTAKARIKLCTNPVGLCVGSSQKHLQPADQ